MIWDWIFLILECDRLLVEYRLGERKNLDQIHAKVEDMNLCILGGLFSIKSDGDDRLTSQDIRGWWVTRGIFRRTTGITS